MSHPATRTRRKPKKHPAGHRKPGIIEQHVEVIDGQTFMVTVFEDYTPEMGREDYGASAGFYRSGRRPRVFKTLHGRPLPEDGSPYSWVAD